jgi:small-conductance mechanosensitive channel
MPPAVALWLATSIAGLALALYGVREAWRDLEALRGIPRNGRWMVARHQLIRYLLRAFICLCFIGAVFVGQMDWATALLVFANIGLLAIALSELTTAAFLRRGIRAKLELEETGND